MPDKGKTILRKGVLFGLNTFSLFASGLVLGKWSLNKARTMAFSQMVVNRVFNLVNEQKTRSTSAPDVGGNPLTLPAVAATVSMLAATMYLPFMGPLFSTVPIGLEDWALLIANAFVTGKVDFFLGAGSKENQNFRAMPLPGINQGCLPSGQN